MEEYTKTKEGMLEINIKVEIKRVWEITDKVEYDLDVAKPKNINNGYIEDTVKTDVRFQDKDLLEKRIENLLLRDACKYKLKPDEVRRQSHEVLYAVCWLQRSMAQPYVDQQITNDLKIFSDVVNMLKQIDKIEPQTRFKLALSRTTRTGVSSIDLPAVTDASDFYKIICITVRQYLISQPKSKPTFALKWYLRNAYKDNITSEKLIEHFEQIRKRKAPHPHHILGLYMDKMLPYLVKQPQFPKSKRTNSTLTEPQGRFFDGFFRLFGFYDQSFKTNLSDEGRMMTTKELRVILNRYRNA